MFDRVKYKKFAKVQLKGRWTIPVLVTLTTAVVSSLFNLPGLAKLPTISILDIVNNPQIVTTINTNSPGNTLLEIISTLVAMIFSYAEVGVYLKMSRSPEPVTFGDFIEGFSGALKAILIGLWQVLWIWLWSLLFIIPGIVKAFAYSQMVYLAHEYPNIPVRKLMKLSMAITKGHKGELFVMVLSFLGWAILCCFTCGIGYLWLNPYESMSFTNAYHAMLKEALDTGKIRMEDLQ